MLVNPWIPPKRSANKTLQQGPVDQWRSAEFGQSHSSDALAHAGSLILVTYAVIHLSNTICGACIIQFADKIQEAVRNNKNNLQRSTPYLHSVVPTTIECPRSSMPTYIFGHDLLSLRKVGRRGRMLLLKPKWHCLHTIPDTRCSRSSGYS